MKTSVVLSGEGADELFLGYDPLMMNLKEWSDSGMNAREIISKFLLGYYISDEDITKVDLAEILELLRKTF